MRTGPVSQNIHLGISTCPNDTFLFHGLLTGLVDTRGLDFQIELCDVEELNLRLLAGEFDVAKASFHAALRATAELGVLPTGSAIGFGNGPLLLAARAGALPGPDSRVLCPGAHTTASLLYRLFHPRSKAAEQVVFSAIVPALERGEADFGVVIHEGRFTYAEHGLHLVEDLGTSWERETGAPLPLGGILARRSLGQPTLRKVQAVLRASLSHALSHRDETLPTMRRYAQELSDEVLLAHVDLYVNRWTADLGATGRAALDALARCAADLGPAGGARHARPLQVIGTERLFHLVPELDWRAHCAAIEDGSATNWQPGSLASQGFVHLSFAEQIAGTLAAHLQGAGRVCLLEVDAGRAGDALVLESAREGVLFPHLQRALEPADLLHCWTLREGPDGWQVPDLDHPPTD